MQRYAAEGPQGAFSAFGAQLGVARAGGVWVLAHGEGHALYYPQPHQLHHCVEDALPVELLRHEDRHSELGNKRRIAEPHGERLPEVAEDIRRNGPRRPYALDELNIRHGVYAAFCIRQPDVDKSLHAARRGRAPAEGDKLARLYAKASSNLKRKIGCADCYHGCCVLSLCVERYHIIGTRSLWALN